MHKPFAKIHLGDYQIKVEPEYFLVTNVITHVTLPIARDIGGLAKILEAMKRAEERLCLP